MVGVSHSVLICVLTMCCRYASGRRSPTSQKQGLEIKTAEAPSTQSTWTSLTEDVEAQHTGVGGPVDVLALRAVPDQLAAVWNVPWGGTGRGLKFLDKLRDGEMTSARNESLKTARKLSMGKLQMFDNSKQELYGALTAACIGGRVLGVGYSQ